MQTDLLFLNYFLMGTMGLVGSEKITNISSKVCEFDPQITTFYFQRTSVFAL